MIIDYSPEFRRRFRKLPRAIKEKALEKEQIFRKDSRDPSLKTHKLSGKLSGCLAFWIDHKNRIIFSFVNSTHVYFLSVGDHDIHT